jgi:hypothetical protein
MRFEEQLHSAIGSGSGSRHGDLCGDKATREVKQSVTVRKQLIGRGDLTVGW